jgi:hypothetical protein
MTACTAEHGDRAGDGDPAGAGWSALSRVAADSVRTIQALQSKLRQLFEEGCGLEGGGRRFAPPEYGRRVSALRESTVRTGLVHRIDDRGGAAERRLSARASTATGRLALTGLPARKLPPAANGEDLMSGAPAGGRGVALGHRRRGRLERPERDRCDPDSLWLITVLNGQQYLIFKTVTVEPALAWLVVPPTTCRSEKAR